MPSAGPLHLLVESRGIKAEGEGPLSAACCACACRLISGTRVSIPLTHASMCCRAMGGPKRRLWRKIHIGIDEQTLEIRAVEVTSSSFGDAPMLPDLLNQIPPGQEIGSVAAPSHACKNALPGSGWGI
jgi:DDE family transposase